MHVIRGDVLGALGFCILAHCSTAALAGSANNAPSPSPRPAPVQQTAAPPAPPRVAPLPVPPTTGPSTTVTPQPRPTLTLNANGTVTATFQNGTSTFMSQQQAAYQYGYRIPVATPVSPPVATSFSGGNFTTPSGAVVNFATGKLILPPPAPPPAPQSSPLPAVSTTSAPSAVVNFATGQVVSASRPFSSVGSSGIANTTSGVLPIQIHPQTNNGIVVGSNASTQRAAASVAPQVAIQLTAAMKLSLQPSYQQVAATGQPPSCVIFVNAKLAEENKIPFPVLGANGTAADLLATAKNIGVPGFAYTPIAAALQNNQIKPGDVLIWQGNIAANGSGHVAYVTSVNGSNVTVEQRDFSSPVTRAQYPNLTSAGHWLDTDTINLSQATKIAGVLSPP